MINMKIRKESIWLFFILAPLLYPSAIRYFILPKFSEIIIGEEGLIFALVLCVLWANLYILKIMKNKLTLAFTCLFLVFIISTILNGYAEYNDYFKWYVSIMILIISYQVALKKNCVNTYIDIIIVTKIIVLFIATCIYIKYPNGITQAYSLAIDGSYNPVAAIYFWGNKNNLVHQFFPLVFLLFYQYEKMGKDNRKIYAKIIINIVVLDLIVLAISCRTATGTAVFVMFYICIIFEKVYKKNNILEILNGKTVALLYVFLEMLLVIFQIQGGIANLISIIMNREIGFTGRTKVWSYAIELFTKSPIIGYGKEAVIAHVGYYWYAHNLGLDILIQGGIIALFIYCYIYKICFMGKYNSKDIYISLLIFSFTQIFESMLKGAPLIYLLFIVSYNNQIINRAKELKHEQQK